MKCKNCGREIPDNSLFCNWCGQRQIKERKKKDEIKIPAPRKLPSGKWRIVLRAEGQSITEATPELCIAKAKAIRAGFLEKKAKVPNLTLTVAIDKYIEARSNTLSPSTIRGYRTIQRNRFKSVMKTPIGKISNWQALCNEEAKLCGPKTLKNAYRFIVSVMGENGVSMPKVKLPQEVKKERPWLEPEQIKTFIAAVHGKKCEIPALLGLCSLRRSEICALTWDKIDLDKGTITVSGAVVEDESSKFVQKDTNKNKTSRRTIPILIPQLKDALAKAKDKTGAIYKNNPNTLRNQVNAVCKRAGLPLVGVHGLRHSFASLAYHLNFSEMETNQLGGWSDTKTVHDIYTHLSRRDRDRAAKKMEKFYKNCTRPAHAT